MLSLWFGQQFTILHFELVLCCTWSKVCLVSKCWSALVWLHSRCWTRMEGAVPCPSPLPPHTSQGTTRGPCKCIYELHTCIVHTSLCNNEQYILHRVKLTAPSKPNSAYTCIVVHSVTLQTKSLLPGVVVPQTALCHSSHPSSSHHARPIQALLPHNFSPKFLPLSFPDSSIPCLCLSPLPTYSHIL